MKFNKNLAIALISLVATVAMAAPASAATYTYQRVCYRTWYGTRCFYVPVATQSPAPAPKPAPAPTPAPAPQQTTPVAGLTAQEQQMLNLVNQERAKAGLAPLKADLTLTKLARLKSQDMINKGYFSHQSPTYGSPFDMMKQFGVTYRTAGENIAGNSSVTGAHTALMNSAGHRANILNSGFTHVGIGIQSGGQYGMMFTQMFVGR